MPDYTTLSDQVELFKTKVTALTSTTLSAYDLVLMAQALNTLAEALGVNDILSATQTQIATLQSTRDSAITTINNSVNGGRLTELETTSTSYGNRIETVENYTATAGGSVAQLSSTVTALDSAIRPNVMSAFQTITSNYTAVARDRLLVVPASNGLLTITLPAIPAIGDCIDFIDIRGTAGTTNFTVARNGKLIQSLDENLIVNVASASFTLTYSDATSGWRIV